MERSAIDRVEESKNERVEKRVAKRRENCIRTYALHRWHIAGTRLSQDLVVFINRRSRMLQALFDDPSTPCAMHTEISHDLLRYRSTTTP